jgi:hypothetical protein
MKKTGENGAKFYCETCDFECRWKSDYTRHLGTSKHIQQQPVNNVDKNQPRNTGDDNMEPKHICIKCSKQYKDRSGLWRHSKTCKKMAPIMQNNIDENEFVLPDKIDTTEVIMSLLKDNKELKIMMAEQNNKIIELMSTKPAAITNITNNTNNTNTINNQFNLNVFLNETCRDAMNINEFIENIEIQMKELEFVANNGYVAGITDIILTRLKQLDISKRPVHCTDLKRETLYVKDKDEWNKDTTENSKIKNMITKVAKKNYCKIPKWREQNPECQNPENEKYDFCINMMRNSLGELGDEQIRLDEKILKNIAKVVVLDKNA